jgi:phosphoribosyl-AMP cyclohydrolase
LDEPFNGAVKNHHPVREQWKRETLKTFGQRKKYNRKRYLNKRLSHAVKSLYYCKKALKKGEKMLLSSHWSETWRKGKTSGTNGKASEMEKASPSLPETILSVL